jgi:iron-sulfur cluster repair protein YtfE (RIC family)
MASVRHKKMEATQVTKLTNQMSPCGGPLPDLEVPMISTMAACLGHEHRKMNDLVAQLAFAAARVAAGADTVTAEQRVLEIWDEIRHDLWSHLQIEDELVFSWGEAHHAISESVLAQLKNERHELRTLMAALPASASNREREARAAGDRAALANTLGAVAGMLDSHIERYDSEVLPAILRALFQR